MSLSTQAATPDGREIITRDLGLCSPLQDGDQALRMLYLWIENAFALLGMCFLLGVRSLRLFVSRYSLFAMAFSGFFPKFTLLSVFHSSNTQQSKFIPVPSPVEFILAAMVNYPYATGGFPANPLAVIARYSRPLPPPLPFSFNC